MKAQKTLQFSECSIMSAFQSLPMPTANIFGDSTSQDSTCCDYFLLTLKHRYRHRKHKDSLSKYILGVTASKQKIERQGSESKGWNNMLAPTAAAQFSD